MKEPEILHIITNWSARGGTESALARLLAHSSLPHQRVIALQEGRPELWNLSSDEVRVTSLRVNGVGSAIAGLWKIRRSLREHKPTALICWLYHTHVLGTLAAQLAGYQGPIYWNIRGCLYYSTGEQALSRGTRAAILIARILRLRPTLGISNSGRALQQHIDAGYIREGVVIPNGIALSAQQPNPRTQCRIIGIAARLHPDKDHLNFFRAAAIIAVGKPEIQFVVAGSGLDSGSPEVMRLVDSSGLPRDRLTLLGEQADLSEFYDSIDLFVLSSMTEGFPNVLLEAMAAGVPCVVTDVGDAADIVGNTGAIAPPRDSDALAAAVRNMIELDEDSYRSRSLAARCRIKERFDLAAVVRRYDELLTDNSDAR